MTIWAPLHSDATVLNNDISEPLISSDNFVNMVDNVSCNSNNKRNNPMYDSNQRMKSYRMVTLRFISQLIVMVNLALSCSCRMERMKI